MQLMGLVGSGALLCDNGFRWAPIAFELVAINVIELIETCAYLLEHYSVCEPAPAKIVQAECALTFKGHSV